MLIHILEPAFEWDENKRLINLEKHGLDLADGRDLFDGRPTVTSISGYGDETRLVTIGDLDGVFVALVWTERNSGIRLISLRRARDAERRKYRARHG